MAERLSTRDDTFISSYADHILRYRFAEPYCQGKRVLDAGCGIGYGAAHLAAHGAMKVTAIDISDAALREAQSLFNFKTLTFQNLNVEKIGDSFDQFDVVVNFENIEHVRNPERLVAGASKLLPSGTFITSTPNGEISTFIDGKLANEFHVKEFTATEFVDLLTPYFQDVRLFGQWLTPEGKLRKLRAKQ